VLATLLFLPSFLFYTSDTYKDGIVQFCVIGVVGSALRLSRRFSVAHLVFAILCMVCLAATRFYLVYATLGPLALGLLGLRSRSVLRVMVSVAALAIGIMAFAGLTRGAEEVFEDANSAYEKGTSQDTIDANRFGGSGVQLQGSSGATYAEALLYTLFAPFLWQGGSIGLQMAKVDALVWYGIVYAAARGIRRLWRTRRTELLVLLSFAIPTLFAYAAAFANIGLTVRERLGVVMICALMAAIGAGPDPRSTPGVAGSATVPAA
jgi:hypothetical protein